METKKQLPRVYGWRKQKKDARDLMFVHAPKAILPPLIDLRSKMPTVYDQSQLGSCTSNAIAAAVEVDLKNPFMPSRLFIYYNERSMEGTVNSDSGAEIRDGIKSINTQGVCDEKIWPYYISRFKLKPTSACYAAAKLHKSLKYYSVTQTEIAIKTALSQWYPVVFGFEVKESFEGDAVAKTGHYLPQPNEKVVGGHAVIIVGYDDSKKTFLVRNSWGPNWGMGGYFTMPYSEVLDPRISNDFWVVQVVQQ